MSTAKARAAATLDAFDRARSEHAAGCVVITDGRPNAVRATVGNASYEISTNPNRVFYDLLDKR